jgi:ribulose-phosphate 3-epimerase
MKQIRLAPSMMCANFIELKPELDLFATLGVDFLHMDIMDGHYVPNFTLGPSFCRSLAEYSNIPLDIHLMIESVDAYVPAFSVAPGTYVSFHPEAVYHPLRTIDFIAKEGAVPGIAVDPATPVEQIRHMIPDIAFVCIMTVNPGYAGQKLIPQMIDKIRELRELCDRRGSDTLIEVDGNVSWQNIPAMLDAGADILVLGTSSLYDGEGSLEENIARLRQVIGAR